MDNSESQPGSPPGGPLQAVSPDRVNQQRESIFSHLRSDSRDSFVSDKISQFNNLSVNMQSKQSDRKSADAALKRAMLGREEAEAEMRRYRDEAKALRKAVEEGKDRERKVGERLEAVMENYGRAKETHAHTQALWEKEIRRARKETFKTQSSIVKLQEELKSARTAVKLADENLKREKDRSKVREQEAFEARYQIVGVQEQLDQALERIKLVEQERDAFKTAAKNEEVARIAAEGRIPLPPAESHDEEFASPKKTRSSKNEPRVSLSTMDILSSAASEAEIEELSEQVQWERQRADRAQEMVEFLQIQCHLRCCPCSRSRANNSLGASRGKRRSSVGLEGPVEKAVKLERESSPTAAAATETAPAPRQSQPRRVEEAEPEVQSRPDLSRPKSRKEPRTSTIFCPSEGIFRTVSEQEAAALEVEKQAKQHEQQVKTHVQSTRTIAEGEAVADDDEIHYEGNPRMYARTPSVEPPSFAMAPRERTSLLSLLNAPHKDACSAPLPSIPSVPCVPDTETSVIRRPELREEDDDDAAARARLDPRLHTSASFYTVTKTTSIPVHDDAFRPSSSFGERLRTPSSSGGSNGQPSFDSSNPALTPTMTREEALAKIRERRGRARSIAQGTMTPRRKMVEGVDRRNMSAPTGSTNRTKGRSS